MACHISSSPSEHRVKMIKIVEMHTLTLTLFPVDKYGKWRIKLKYIFFESERIFRNLNVVTIKPADARRPLGEGLPIQFIRCSEAPFLYECMKTS